MCPLKPARYPPAPPATFATRALTYHESRRFHVAVSMKLAADGRHNPVSVETSALSPRSSRLVVQSDESPASTKPVEHASSPNASSHGRCINKPSFPLFRSSSAGIPYIGLQARNHPTGPVLDWNRLVLENRTWPPTALSFVRTTTNHHSFAAVA